MKVAFISNYINHHQLPFSDAMNRILGKENYKFIETEPIETERLQLGWKNSDRDYVIRTYISDKENEKAHRYVDEADVVICGHVTSEPWILKRLQENKITFIYSERIYKLGQWRAVSPRGYKVIRKQFAQYQQYPAYILAASAYLPCDLGIFHLYKDRIFKWGYFPQFVEQKNVSDSRDPNGKLSIIWVGRFIDWKRPQLAIIAANHLKRENVDFHVSMIGTGPLMENIQSMIEESGLSNDVSIEGKMPPEQVREKMKNADIFLSTSDYKEGWGAVINEAMNSGCAVIASHAMGAVPYLLHNKQNGLIFKSEDTSSMLQCFDFLIKNRGLIKKYGDEAYRTIRETWNADIAASRLLELVHKIQNGNTDYAKDGPCSIAPLVKQRKMWKYVK